MSGTTRLRHISGTAMFALSIAGQDAVADEIMVFAAASLTNAMTEIEARFEGLSGHDVIVSLAGSSVLSRQIWQGAPADVFISANPGWMDVLEQEGLIEAGGRFDLLGNSLVLVASNPKAAEVEIGPGLDLSGLLGGGWLAMALVEAVPAGIYGKAALESLGLWSGIETQLAQTDNVRTALRLVSSGEAPYGIVYATDAAAEGNVTLVGTFPAGTHPPIVYPAADLANRDTEAEGLFLDYLQSPEAREIFERQGFVVVAGQAY